jgi:sugar O-acyltransferase (sialic acid O-acetyltransferase NeuD family)
MKSLIIIGGEGHGSVIASCINDNKRVLKNYEWEIAGFINDYDKEVDGYPVLGKLKDINKFVEKGYYFIWAIHLIQRNVTTYNLYRQCNIPKERLATIVHHSAFLGENVILEPGVVVMPHVYIASRTKIGESTLVKANALVGHDVQTNILCHLAMGSITGSYVQLGLCSDVASGANVLNNIIIGDYAMAGASSLITHNIPDNEIHVGIPARFLKKINVN